MGSPVQLQYYQPRPEDYQRTVFTDDRMQLNRQQLNNFVSPSHTIRKCQNMARQNTSEILLLDDANMIGEH